MSTKGAKSSSKNKGGGGGSKPSTPSRKNSAQSPLVNQRKSLDRSGQRSRVSSIVSDLSDDEDSVVSTSSRGSRGSVRSNQSNQNKGVQSKGGQSKSPSKGPNKLKGAGLAVMATNRRKQRGSRSRASFEMPLINSSAGLPTLGRMPFWELLMSIDTAGLRDMGPSRRSIPSRTEPENPPLALIALT